jgi:hypothetical protein
MGFSCGFANRYGVLALMAEGDLLLTRAAPVLSFVPALFRLAVLGSLGGMLGPEEALAADFGGLRAGSWRLLDRFGRGELRGLAYGRFGIDGRLGGVFCRIRLGRGISWCGCLLVLYHSGL